MGPPRLEAREQVLAGITAARGDSETGVPTFNETLREAHRIGVAYDMQIGTRKLHRLIRAFLATRTTDQEFEGWLTEYADPTGEAAVWNVFKERGW